MTKASRSRTSRHASLRIARRRRSLFAPVEEAIAAIRDGRLVIVVDDEDRENEGDLTIAAEKITPDVINFMVTHGRGLVCLAMTPERLDALEIPLAVPVNSAVRETAMCVPVDARGKTSTGISAADRAATVLAAIDPATTPQDLLRPGHVTPLRARNGGVLVRSGHTEAAVDLARLAGLTPAGVICEIMARGGTMARALAGSGARILSTYSERTLAELEPTAQGETPQRHAGDHPAADHDHDPSPTQGRIAPSAEEAGGHRGREYDRGTTPVY